MKLSKRLYAIYSLIPDNVRIIDVGCDHALLDIYTVFNKRNVTCLAIEKNYVTLEKAINNIKKYHMTDKIKTIVNDGLAGIQLFNDDYVVIAGMGSFNIIKILKEIDFNVNNLIIQANTNNDVLINLLLDNNFIIEKRLEIDEYKYYEVVKLRKI